MKQQLAWAEPSVTIYGVVDAYVQALDGASGLARVQSGGLNGSRLGFRGQEDLGGGLRAVFTLESGFNIDDGSIGQGGAFYGRQAFVGLQGAFGQLTLGRQYSSLYVASADFSIFSNNPVGPSTALIGGFGGYEPVRGAANTATPPAAGATGNGGPARVNNSVRYATPAWNGFTAVALYGAGEVAGASSDARLVDLGLRYTGGGLDVIVSVVDDKAFNGGLTVTQFTTATLAATYTLADLRVAAGFVDVNDKRAANQDGRGYWLGAQYALGQHLLKAQFVQNEPRYASDNKTSAYGLGWGYELSKRSTLYASVTRFDNDGQAGVGGLGRLHSTVPAGLTALGDNKVTELVAGLRHTF
jgi:predicted porin